MLSTAQSSPVSGPVDDLNASAWPPELLGSSPLARRVREQVRRAANGPGRVLIMVESGLDAGAVARAIHRQGSRPVAPMVTIDCAREDPADVEQILFGRPAGASPRRADGLEHVTVDCPLVTVVGGSIYLANVADLAAPAQARLARVLRDGEVRVGEPARTVKLGPRVVAGCAPTIDAEVQQGSFRADLYRRLSSVRVDVPPLRQRPEDIPAIARHVMDQLCASRGAARTFTKAALALLSALPWSGNLRELADVLARVTADASSTLVRVEDLLAQVGPDWPGSRSVGGSLREAKRQFEREYIAAVLRQHGWRMGDAARALGIQRTNLYRKARQLNIPRVRAR